MAWTIEYSDKALKALKRLDRQIAERIINAMEQKIAHKENPRQDGKPLSGRLAEYWRYRIGDYRVICLLKDEVMTILVVDIGHRGNIYQ
ncbi:MAG: type II toxin-antitoxin system RelE/ParE family toxin [Methylococcaceae bacterium]|nr:type II toxin-antitoxin system RelE/ParE family toxin [Methylococcaceae bacterium]